MTRFSDGPTVEVSTVIAASPERVWDFVTDINVPARFQDEFMEAVWLDGPGLGAGAAFRGRNQRGHREWETTSYVIAYEPERVFGWAVDDLDNPGATWTFRLVPSDGATTLVYRRTLGPGPSGLTRAIEKYPEREEEIIEARDEVHHANMQAVVDGIKDLAEKSER